MSDSDSKHPNRRHFLRSLASAGVLVGACRPNASPQNPLSNPSTQSTEPEKEKEAMSQVDAIKAAEKFLGVNYTDKEREQLADGLEDQLASILLRRRLSLPNSLAPSCIFDPRLPGMTFENKPTLLKPSKASLGPVPTQDEDLAFAPVTALSRWLSSGKLTSTRLTKLYLKRLKEIGPKLHCVITLTEELALAQAKQADAELSKGKIRGPLHGIPWGAKDLLDTKNILTTWGAAPYQKQIPEENATVVSRLADAGAVLMAKLSLGALAYGDIWFKETTRNPWNVEEGSSGSSAGSAAATAAGLVGFSLGTETLGSIISPSMRCGTTGLRPTFGRVPRGGAMALCWSLDKIGPICRTVEDTALVLHSLIGEDSADPASLSMPFRFDGRKPLNKKQIRLGYDPKWFQENPANDIDRNVLEIAKRLGFTLVNISLPELPYSSLIPILLTEAAAAFEELTLSDQDDQLRWQEKEAWPNTFRSARFLSAIDVLQAERFRRLVMQEMAKVFTKVDALISPSFAASLLTITNFTGHPSLTLRAGFFDSPPRTLFGQASKETPVKKVPYGVTLWGNLFEEGTLCRIGIELEKELGVWNERPVL